MSRGLPRARARAFPETRLEMEEHLAFVGRAIGYRGKGGERANADQLSVQHE